MQFTARFHEVKVIFCTMVFVLLSTMFWLGAGHGKEATGVPPKAVEPNKPAVVLPAGGPGAASHLRAEPDCDKAELRKGVARLSWTVAAKRGREQRVEVTIYRRGFERGAFEASSSLPADQASLVWDRVKGQAIHRWRVLTLQAEGWVPSETATFEGPPCVADFTTPPGKSS